MYNSISDTRIIGKKIIYLPSCHSTNDIAAELVRSVAFEEGTIVIADQQTNGRGQRGSNWASEPGLNLTFTVALVPVNIPIMQQFLLSQMVALGLVGFLKTVGVEAAIKWPNDIYVNDLKICGTLLENSIQGTRITTCLAGIGLNVNQKGFVGMNATSLSLETGKDWALEVAFELLVKHLDFYYTLLSQGAFETIRAHYLSNLLGLNVLRYFKIADQMVQATVVGISDFGHLQLLLLGKKEPIELDLKEVEWVWNA